MKKTIVFLFVLATLFALSGCVKSPEDETTTAAVATTEKPVEKVSVLTKISFEWIVEDGETSEIVINEKGLIESTVRDYETNRFYYDDAGKLIKRTLTQTDGKGSSETYEYNEDGYARSSDFVPDGLTRTPRTSNYSYTKGSDGLPVEMIDDKVFTKDTGTENDWERLEIEYDSQGRVAKVSDYMHEADNLDHTETMEYDEEGKLVAVTFTGESAGEYLKYTLHYETADAGAVPEVPADAFQAYFNMREVLDAVL